MLGESCVEECLSSSKFEGGGGGGGGGGGTDAELVLGVKLVVLFAEESVRVEAELVLL